VHGTNEISKISFRVPNDLALDYWLKRFDRLEVKHTGIREQFGKQTLSFIDFDNQHYQLISDEDNEGVESGIPWQKGPIPLEHAITGLGPIFIRISNFDFLKEVLEKSLLFKEMAQEGAFHLFEVGEGDRKSTRLNSSHVSISYAVFCLIKIIYYRISTLSLM